MEQNNYEQERERAAETQPQRREGRMNRRAVMLTIILFLVLVAGMFIFAYLQQDDSAMSRDENDAIDDADDRFAMIDTVSAKHFYEDGVHTLVGEIAMPTPCDLLEANARVAESMPEQVTVAFSVVNNAEFCAQTVTSQRFMVTASASEEATFDATFEGRSIELNLVEPAAGETPEDFELFIKG